MARRVGDSGQAAVLDAGQIRRLLKIASTTSFGQRDQTVITLSYWLGLRAKELASLKVGDVYLADGSVKQILHLKAGYTKRARMRDVYLSSDKVVRRLKEYGDFLLGSREFAYAHRSTGASHKLGRAVALASSAKASSDQCHTAILDLPLFMSIRPVPLL